MMDENTLGRMLYDLNNKVQEINTKVTDLKVKIGNREEEIIKAIDKDTEARLKAEPDANMRIGINNVRDSKVKKDLEYDDEIRGLKKNVDDLMKKHERLWEQHEILTDLKNLYIDYNSHLPIYDKNSYTYYYGNKSYDDVFKQRVEEFVKKGKDLGISFNLEKINNEGTDSFTTSDKNVSMTDNIPSNNTQDDLKNSFDNQFSNEIGVGGKHFKPNQTDAEYATFKKDGTLHLVGNFSEDWFRENYQKLVGDLITDDVKKVTCWNKLDYGVTPLAGLDVKVEVSSDGIEIIGDVEDLNYFNKEEDLPQLSEETIYEEKFDDLPKNRMDDNLVNEELDIKSIVPVTSKKVDSRKAPKPSLWQKFKNLKTWQKAAIVAGVIAVVGVGVFVVGPHIVEAINNLINPENVNTVHQTAQSLNDTVASSTPYIDYSSVGEGQTVFTNAYDAVNNANGVMSNAWFDNNPLDVYNTASGTYLGLTPEQLHDPNLLAELAQDPNNALLFGDSMANSSGFVPLDDIVSEVTKVR